MEAGQPLIDVYDQMVDRLVLERGAISFDNITRPSDPVALAKFLLELLDSGVHDINCNDNEPLVIFYNTDNVIKRSSVPTFCANILPYYSNLYTSCPHLSDCPHDVDDLCYPQIMVSISDGIYNIYTECGHFPGSGTMKIHPTRMEIEEFFQFMDGEGIKCYDCCGRYLNE